ncbi:MAG: cell division protein FtsQ/DivIB [Sphaerochaeta sp.]|uniref:cell division protein FtsQ/DivIB n=1 Tax=Sphaerochaeta sp. TaxID=1972642 RepID=UPI003D1049EE
MRRPGIKVQLMLLLIPVFFLLVIATLRFIPQFDVRAIQVTIQGGSKETPPQATERLASLVGTSLFTINLSRQEALLASISSIASVQLRRKLPSILEATITLVDSPVLVLTDRDGQAYLVKDQKLLLLDAREIPAWKKVVSTIEVPVQYAELMSRYRVDDSFLQVLDLVQSLTGKTTLITTIKYDNNSSNSFGKMVLELSSLHAQIWVREPVSAAHVQAAVALVAQQQKDALSFLSSGTSRYDLYREGLVRRQ